MLSGLPLALYVCNEIRDLGAGEPLVRHSRTMRAREESREPRLAEPPRSGNLCKGRNGVGGSQLPRRDDMTFCAPALGDPPPPGAIRRRALPSRYHEERRKSDQTHAASTALRHNLILPGGPFQPFAGKRQAGSEPQPAQEFLLGRGRCTIETSRRANSARLTCTLLHSRGSG